MKWIKASERKPVPDPLNIIRNVNNKRLVEDEWFQESCKYKTIKLEDYEYLDESAPVDDVVGGWQEMLRRYRAVINPLFCGLTIKSFPNSLRDDCFINHPRVPVPFGFGLKKILNCTIGEMF